MIFLSNLSFAYIILFILIYNGFLLISKKKIPLNWLLLIGSILVLNTIVTLASLSIIIGLSVAVYFTGKYLNTNSKHKRWILNISVFALILLFCLKNYSLANFDWVQRVGLSYILFRLIHFLIDSSKNKIVDFNIFSFVNYIIFFPTFMAGPIDEYESFNYWIKQTHSSYRIALFKAGIFKLVLGIVKKFFLVPIIVSYSLDFSLFDQSGLWQEGFIISLFFYSFYILFDFSGYSDIAIGTAYLIGIKTPENFDNPYGAKNLSIFWKKWHMTFSNFLFKYVFKPMVTWFSAKLPNWPRIGVSSIGYILTFIICGIWHGNTLNFIYWGLWHGLGLIGFKLWDIYIYKKSIAKINQPIIKKIYNLGALMVTFSFVSIGWFFFNYQHTDVHHIIKNFSNKNDSSFTVLQGNFENKKCFEINYIPKNTNSQLVDIEFEVPHLNHTYKFYNLAINKNNLYHVLIAGKKNNLNTIRIREKSKNNVGNWHTKIIYAKLKSFNQSDLQLKIFGKYQFNEQRITEVDSLYGTGLIIDQRYLDQKLKTVSKLIPNYGWAIQIDYLANNDLNVIVEFKFEGEDWQVYNNNRHGKYDYIHIHGNEKFNGNNRNLKPGKYSVRIRYSDGSINSNWINDMITILNYADN